MFMNARPRNVSNGFGTFVPVWKTKPVHQRIVDTMNNNKVNAGGSFWPVATTEVNDTWDCSLNDFHGDQNSLLYAQNSGYVQNSTTSYSQAPVFNYEKVLAYSPTSHSQHQAQGKQFTVQQAHDDPVLNLNCFAEHSPMLANGDTWASKYRDGSFAESSIYQNSTKFANYQRTSSISGLNSHVSASSLSPMQSLGQGNTSGNSSLLSLESHCNLGVQSNCPSNSTSVNGSSFTYSAIPRGNSSTKDPWYSETFNMSDLQYHDYCRLASSHDGLPRSQMPGEHFHACQGYGDMWNFNYEADETWSSQPHLTSPRTVSPKALTLIVPPVPLSSSGSPNDIPLSLSDSSTGTSSDDDDLSVPEKSTVAKPVPVRSRQILPDSLPTSQRLLPELGNEDQATTVETRSRTGPLQAKSDTSQLGEATPSHINHCMYSPASHNSQNKFRPKRIEPKPVDPATEQLSSKASQPSRATHQRDAKDSFLIQSKLAGMSYKDIRKQGGFTEAESTLRGRFRTLTKAKSARVRKPEWNNNDIRLLQKAVRSLSTPSDYVQSRVPWKQVADYIANNGGSYHFGNATCRKKWDELNEDADD